MSHHPAHIVRQQRLRPRGAGSVLLLQQERPLPCGRGSVLLRRGQSNIWAHFGEEYRVKNIVWLKESKTFKDKCSAINQDTGVNGELVDMIMRCCYPSRTLAVGNMEYKRIIEKSLPVHCLFNETVMEATWGLKNLMHVLVPCTRRKTQADKERSPTNEPRTKMAAGSLWLWCETRDGLWTNDCGGMCLA